MMLQHACTLSRAPWLDFRSCDLQPVPLIGQGRDPVGSGPFRVPTLAPPRGRRSQPAADLAVTHAQCHGGEVGGARGRRGGRGGATMRMVVSLYAERPMYTV